MNIILSNVITLNQDKLAVNTGIIERFVNRYKSEDTRRSYSQTLKVFFKVNHLEHITNDMIKNIGILNIEHYVKEMVERGIGASTIRQRVSVLKSMVKYTMAFCNEIKSNPFNSGVVKEYLYLNLDKNEIDVGRALSKDEVNKILEASKSEPRDNLIISLLFYLGVRRHEFIKINWKDFVWDEKYNSWYLIVKGKGRKERLLKIRPNIVEKLNEYFFKRFGAMGSSDNVLFPMTSDNLNKIVHKHSKKVGLEVSCHDCRRSCLTAMVLNGAPLEVTKEYAGHSSVQTLINHYYKPIQNRLNNGGDYNDLG